MTETTVTKEQVTWEPLPDDFKLPDEPVENLEHPTLAGDLTELLRVAGLLTESAIVASNFGICAKVGKKTIVKAPDWVYIPFARPAPSGKVRKSYTPHLEGDIPSVVMEFLSDTDNGEYNAEFGGKWWFYEQILQVPRYAIFEPTSGRLELYQLKKSGKYSPQIPDRNGRYWIPGLNLFLGVWFGTEKERTGYFLRWWDDGGNMLLWWSEKSARERQQVEQERQQAEQERQQAEQERQQAEQRLQQERQRAEQERQQAEQERQQAEQERQRSERLAARLRELGIDPDELN